MPPEDREKLAKSRWQTLQLLRLTGFITMILGLWISTGDILRTGGWLVLGVPIFMLGMFEALLLPTILAKRWNRQSGK